MKLLRFPDRIANLPLEYILDDDFFSYTDGQLWTQTLTTGTGGIAANTAGGVYQLTSGAGTNDSSVLATTNAVFKYLAGRVWAAQFFVQYAEANTNKAMVAVGLSSVVTNVLLQDTTGVPATSFSGALIYKDVGATQWKAIASVGSTQVQTNGQQTAGGTTNGRYGNGYTLLRIEARDVDGTNFEVTYFVDNQPLLDTTSFHRPIKHTIALTSAAAMKPVVFLKAGSGSNETLNLDYAAAFQRRG